MINESAKVLMTEDSLFYLSNNILHDIENSKNYFDESCVSEVKSAVSSGKHIFIITSNEGVLSSGDNFCNQLSEDNRKELRLYDINNDKNIKAIYTNYDYSVIRYNDNTLKGFGIKGAILNYNKDCIKNNEVVKIALGNEHILILYKDGTVWAMGSNEFGQLGLIHSNKTLEPLSKVPNIKSAIDIFTIHNRSFIVMKDDCILAFGENAKGQLGTGDYENKYNPQVSIGLKNIATIKGTKNTTVFSSCDGTVKITGENLKDIFKLGIEGVISIPKSIKVLKEIVSIDTNRHFFSFINKNEDIYICGSNQRRRTSYLNCTKGADSFVVLSKILI